MMDYCILNDENIIENMIVCADDVTAEEFGAVPSYEGAKIGDKYDPPPPPPTLEERVGNLEQSMANQADVDKLNEALNMILTGVTV